MNMIIETDCGHDPDDFFTLCYLHSAGVNIRAIVSCAGDPDQLAIVRLFCEEVGLDIPIGNYRNSIKYSSGSVHHALLDRYGRSRDGKSDGDGEKIIRDTLKQHPDSDIFVIGPPNSTGRYFAKEHEPLERLTMQGGFLGYDLHPHASRRESKFEGKTWVPTFNMNGDVEGTKAILKAQIGTRRFCGKNVCHTVIFNKEMFEMMGKPKDRASELFMEGMEILLRKHDGKKFHDPVAAVCHLHPEIGTWVRGKVQRVQGGWGTVLDEAGDYILADLDYDAFWLRIMSWT